jgi:hypothetical protein
LATGYHLFGVPHRARFKSDWIDFVYGPAHIIAWFPQNEGLVQREKGGAGYLRSEYRPGFVFCARTLLTATKEVNKQMKTTLFNVAMHMIHSLLK